MKGQHVELHEAVRLHVNLAAKYSIGLDCGTFALADDPLNLRFTLWPAPAATRVWRRTVGDTIAVAGV